MCKITGIITYLLFALMIVFLYANYKDKNL